MEFFGRTTERERNLRTKQAMDKQRIQQWLRGIQGSYQPNIGLNYLNQILNVAKLAPNPIVKGMATVGSMVTPFLDKSKYDVSGAPDVMFGSNIIKEFKNRANFMNQTMMDKRKMEALQALAGFGFKDVKDAKGDKTGKSLFQMLLEKYKARNI